MLEMFGFIRKVVMYVFILFYVPLFLLAQSQSFTAIYEQQGAEALNPLRIWFISKNNARVIWLKTIGVFPRASLLPMLGGSYVVEGSGAAQQKWGGCQVNLKQDSYIPYDVALGVAKCTDYQDQKISESFAQMNAAQIDQAYSMLDKTKKIRSGMLVYIQIAYAILALADGVGPVSVSEYLDQQCSLALKGGQSQKHFCLVALEVEEVLNRVVVASESERKAVAVKAGMQAWLWMISDPGMSKIFWAEWINSAPNALDNTQLRNWAAAYSSYKEGKASLALLRKTWGGKDLEVINSILKKNQLKPIDEKAWVQERSGK